MSEVAKDVPPSKPPGGSPSAETIAPPERKTRPQDDDAVRRMVSEGGPSAPAPGKPAPPSTLAPRAPRAPRAEIPDGT